MNSDKPTPPARGDNGRSGAQTWAVVATVRAPKEMVDVFISHYLSLGADEVHIFFDDPEIAEYDVQLSQDPKLKITICGTDFWAGKNATYPLLIDGRPINVEGRQFSNYLQVQHESTCDWILNVDVDELLISARDIPVILDEFPANVFIVAAKPLEAVYTAAPTLENLFDTTYFKQPYEGFPKFVRKQFTPDLLPNKHGYWGHRRGKGFFRRAEQIMTLSCHFPKPLNSTLHHRLFHPELEILHFECMTFDLFHEKRLRRITGDSLTTRIHRVTRARLRHFKRTFELGGVQATRELYEHMNVFNSSRLERAIEAGFVVQRSRLRAYKPKNADFQIRSQSGNSWVVDAVKGVVVEADSESGTPAVDQNIVRLRLESADSGHAYLYHRSQDAPTFIIPDEQGKFVSGDKNYAYLIEYKFDRQQLRLRFPNTKLPEKELTIRGSTAIIQDAASSAPPDDQKVEMTTSPAGSLTYQHISADVTEFLNTRELDRFITKIWVYRGRCLVIDFVYQGVSFNFDFILSSAGTVSVDLVQRRRVGGRYLTPSTARKRRILEDSSLGEALPVLEATARKMFSRIDGFLNPATIDATSSDIVTPPENAGQDKNPLTVGVLTLPLNKNFGGNLQAYALMEAIRRLGHEPVLINRRHPPKNLTSDEGVSRDKFATTYGLDRRLPNASFVDKYLSPITRRFDSSEEIGSHIGEYQFDAIVVGSDQVWRAKYAKSILLDFFLGFVGERPDLARISYGASFGADKIAYGDALLEASRLAKQLDAVSVREASGVELCKQHFGIAAEHVVDPTLLLEPEDYQRLWQDSSVTPPRDQLVAYVLDATPEKQNLIEVLSQRLGVEAYATNGMPAALVDALKSSDGDRSIEAWLAALHAAKFVVTDSYHGVVFSVLFNKPFVAYGNPKRGMARFTSLLSVLGLQNRLLTHTSAFDAASLLAPIDWPQVNARLAEHRVRSLNFLRSALARKKSHVQRSSDTDATRGSQPAQSAAGPLAYIPRSVLCTGCGVCVSESNGSLKMAWDEDGFLVPQPVGSAIPDKAVKVCPFNPEPDKEVQDEDALARMFLAEASNVNAHAGHFENTYIGYSRSFRESSSSGGISTYVLEQLLERRVVDYIYVVQTDGASGYRYQACKNLTDLRSISKTRYYPVSMDDLFATIDRTDGRVAITGVACFIKAVRLKQYYRPEYRSKIPFLLGIVCGGLKSRHYTDFLAQSAGISGHYSQPEYRVKDHNSKASDYSFSAVDSAQKTRAIKMQLVGANWGAGLFKAKACDFCTDVLTELADISLGDAWLPGYRDDGRGHNIVITRSALADEIIRTGIERDELHAQDVPVDLMVKSQAGGFNHKRNGVKFRRWVAHHFSPLPVPKLRERICRDLTVADAVVQVQRERTRSKSLAYWRETLNSELFRKRMRASRRALKVATSARKDGSNAPLIAMLEQSGTDAMRRDTETRRHAPLRWLLWRLGRQPFGFSTLKAALFGSGPVERPRS